MVSNSYEMFRKIILFEPWVLVSKLQLRPNKQLFILSSLLTFLISKKCLHGQFQISVTDYGIVDERWQERSTSQLNQLWCTAPLYSFCIHMAKLVYAV